MTWPGPPLSGDQADIIGLVDAIVGKHGAAPQDEYPAEVAKARQALADAGLWTLGAAEGAGGGGAPLPLLLAFLASVGRHWAALAWASAQAHAAIEVLGGDPAWGELTRAAERRQRGRMRRRQGLLARQPHERGRAGQRHHLAP